MKTFETCKVNGLSVAIHHSGNDSIVCCHGLYSSKNSDKYLEIANLAYASGISCIRFDFKGCGESDGPFSINLEDRIRELATIMRFVKKRYPNGRFALLGSSLGGMTVLRYAARHPVFALVLMATPAALSLEGNNSDVRADAKNCKRTLVIHGIQDELVPPTNAMILYNYLKEPKKISMYDTDHSFSDPIERTKALREAICWFTHYFE